MSNKIECVCEICSEQFLKFPSAIKAGRGKYCSKQCMNKGVSLIHKANKYHPPHLKGSANGRYRHDRQDMICPICEVRFRPLTDDIKTCSRLCADKFRSNRIKGENNPFSRMNPAKIKTCEFCKEEYSNSVTAKKRGSGDLYCSIQCFRKDHNSSYRARTIAEYIETLGYSVILEKTWSWLISPFSKHKMRVDIYIPEKHLAIEYDGRQHFEPAFGKGVDGLELIMTRDKVKNELLHIHDIPLLRISNPIDFELLKKWIESN